MKRCISLLLALFLLMTLVSCGQNEETVGEETKTFTVAMECAYAPYNWTQSDDSNGAVPIKDSNDFANGYDVQMAKKIAEAYGWELEIVRLDWDSLIPAVQTGQVDAVIAGQSMTAEREQQVDFAGPYLYATIVCLTLADSPLASATSIQDLAGYSCTSQLSTIWYDNCLSQIENADIRPGKESAPAMLMALETGDVDFVCTDMPTAMAALQAFDDMVLLDFNNTDGNFVVSDEEINIGISLMKGNSELKEQIDAVVKQMSADDFNHMMDEAIAIQPVNE